MLLVFVFCKVIGRLRYKHGLSLARGYVTYPDTGIVYRRPLLRSLLKMADVGQRLGTAVYRLPALRTSHTLPLRTSENRLTETSSRDRREAQSVTKRKATQSTSAKLSRVRTAEGQQEYVALRRATSCDVETRERLLSYKTTLYISPRLQPLLHEKLLSGRMTSWTRGEVSIHPDTFRNHQHIRTLFTVVFILAKQGSERPGHLLRQRCLKLHPETLQVSTTSRGYSWRSNGSSEDVPLMYRSRTAYYDILKVSPNATQANIKTAYYKQSFIYHPDKNPGNKAAVQRFSEISEAYTVLGNISLRRKYDRGILSQSDIQSAGRPSSKETSSRSRGSPQQQQQRHQRAQQFSQSGEKIKFDFDAFYKAHYGEQLRREKAMRDRKQYIQEQQRENFRKWTEGRLTEMSVVMMMAMAGLIFISLIRP